MTAMSVRRKKPPSPSAAAMSGKACMPLHGLEDDALEITKTSSRTAHHAIHAVAHLLCGQRNREREETATTPTTITTTTVSATVKSDNVTRPEIKGKYTKGTSGIKHTIT